MLFLFVDWHTFTGIIQSVRLAAIKIQTSLSHVSNALLGDSRFGSLVVLCFCSSAMLSASHNMRAIDAFVWHLPDTFCIPFLFRQTKEQHSAQTALR
jgi:hypothetical protein